MLALAVASLVPTAAVGGAGNGKIVFWSEGRLYAVDPASGVEADLGPGTEPAWSPDGSQIAFRSGGLSVMNADGSGRRVLYESADARRAVWSPDGARLAFLSGQPAALLVVDVAGGGARSVAAPVVGDSPPAWSPDGTKLAYTESVSFDLAVVGADGTGKQTLTAGPPHTADAGAAWSPDGKEIAFSRTGNGEAALHLVASEGGPARRLAQTVFDSYAPMAPAWSPDGTRIAFTGAKLVSYSKVGPFFTTDVYTTDAEGTLVRRLTVADSFRVPSNAAPAWSPDGTRILFQSARDWVGPTPTTGIYMMNADGTCETRVGGRSGQSPAWQPVPLVPATPPLRCADLELVVTNDRRQVAAGGEERFGIHVKNLETEPATAVRLKAEVPAGGSFVSASPQRGTCSLAGGSLACELGTLEVGGSIPVNVVTRAASIGQFFSPLRVTANELDGNQANNKWELRFEALPCDLAGTWNADNMVGTRGPDTICALYGADLVHGLAGNDSLDAGGGPDRVFPGPGRDSVALRAGADFVDARDGERDTISCGGERDVVLADRFDRTTGGCELVARPSLRCSTLGTGRANDLVGSSRNDSICALNGNDTVHAGPGADGVDGGAGNDTLHGGPGRDLLIGGEGYDTILARDGERDRIRCGPQDDLVKADRIDVVAPDCERVRRL